MTRKIDITNVKYLQDKADGYKFYLICTRTTGAWYRGQIIGKFKTDKKPLLLAANSLFSDYLTYKPVGERIKDSDL